MNQEDFDRIKTPPDLSRIGPVKFDSEVTEEDFSRLNGHEETLDIMDMLRVGNEERNNDELAYESDYYTQEDEQLEIDASVVEALFAEEDEVVHKNDDKEVVKKPAAEIEEEQAAPVIEDEPVQVKRYTDMSEVNADVLDKIKKEGPEGYLPKEIETEGDIMKNLISLADNGDPSIQNVVGVCYCTGYNVPHDIEKAIKYFEMAAEKDYAPAERNLAILFEEKGEAEKAFELYSKAAAQDDIYAMNNLGACYLIGDGVKADPKQAVKWFKKAVKGNDDLAMINLADCYALGNGIIKSETKAFTYYKMAADKDNVEGIKKMADCYLKGFGVKQDYRRALEAYTKAASMGDKEALLAVKEIEKKLSPQKHKANPEKSDRATIEEMFAAGDRIKEKAKAEMGKEQKTPEKKTADKGIE